MWCTDERFHRNDASAVPLAGEIRTVAGKLKRKLRKLGGLGDLTPSQASVLVHLESHGPATVTALARAEAMRPRSMGAIIAVLEAAGLVSGAPDPNDGRRTILCLTAACTERVAAVRAARQDYITRIIRAELSLVKQDQLATGLALLKRIIDR